MKRQFSFSLLLLSTFLSLNAQIYTPGGSVGSSGNNNVGIGTSSPAKTLHLFSNNSNTYIRLDKSSINYESGFVFGINESSDFFMYTDNGNNSLKIQAAGLSGEVDATPRMEFPISNKNILMGLSGGNVGIGTTSPPSKLSVYSNGPTTISMHNIAAAYGNQTNEVLGFLSGRTDTQAEPASFGGVKIITDATYWYKGRLGFFTNNIDGTDPYYPPTEKMTILANGNVGIGTTDPGSYKLNVNGTIRANEIVVSTPGADFVFKPEYNLSSLPEVEKFIIENNHLPDLASATEMQENGMNVSEMQTKLLQKIEELTLYAIEQNKKNESQSKEIELLKQQVALLMELDK